MMWSITRQGGSNKKCNVKNEFALWILTILFQIFLKNHSKGNSQSQHQFNIISLRESLTQDYCITLYAIISCFYVQYICNVLFSMALHAEDAVYFSRTTPN